MIGNIPLQPGIREKGVFEVLSRSLGIRDCVA